MNSRQRRASLRYWRHVIELPYQDRWDIDDLRKQWCNKNIGKQNTKWATMHYGQIWYFNNEKDAAFFALKWC